LLRIVYRITTVAIDSHKQTADGVTVDIGAGQLALIQIQGSQLTDGDQVLAEKTELRKK
jgi:hypothetical protein